MKDSQLYLLLVNFWCAVGVMTCDHELIRIMVGIQIILHAIPSYYYLYED